MNPQSSPRPFTAVKKGWGAWAFIALGLGGACGLGASCQKSGTREGARTSYDAKPLRLALRSSEREASHATPSALGRVPLYDLKLEVSGSLARYKLEQEIYFENQDAEILEEVVLRLYANAVADSPPIRFVSGKCHKTSCALSQPAASVVVVKPERPLEKGHRLRIALRLEGQLPSIAPSRTNMLAQGLESMSRMRKGKGAGDYGLLSRSGNVASFANFYALVARRQDGKWVRQEASTMGDLGAAGLSNVRLKVSTPKHVRLATSGVIKSSREQGENKQVEIVGALVRDFSILMSPSFREKKAKVGDVIVRSHFLTGHQKAGARVLDAAAASLKVFEQHFGPYPYADLDIVEAPLVGGAGGVEFSGLVTVATMLYQPPLGEGLLSALGGLLGGGGPDIKDISGNMLEFVTAHELAHQYFPGLVGSDSRKHPYQDESMAQYAAMLYFEKRYGKARAKLEGERQVAANYFMMRLLGTPDAAVDRPVDAFSSELAYAGLVYGKGPFFYREARKRLGDKLFFSTLRQYVDAHRFKQTKPEALTGALAVGDKKKEIRSLSRRWLKEAHGDKDLGRPSMERLLEAYLGADAVKQMGPELRMAMQILLRFMSPQKASQKSDQGSSLLDLLKQIQ